MQHRPRFLSAPQTCLLDPSQAWNEGHPGRVGYTRSSEYGEACEYDVHSAFLSFRMASCTSDRPFMTLLYRSAEFFFASSCAGGGFQPKLPLPANRTWFPQTFSFSAGQHKHCRRQEERNLPEPFVGGGQLERVVDAGVLNSEGREYDAVMVQSAPVPLHIPCHATIHGFCILHAV